MKQNKFIQELTNSMPSNYKEGDYIDEKTGRLFCGNCHTAKQLHICEPGIFDGIVPCLCTCEQEALLQLHKAEKEKEKAERLQRRIQAAFFEPTMRKKIFETSEPTAIVEICRKYAKNWKHYQDTGLGLLMYGTSSTGKSHAAACIVNNLIDRGYTAIMTNFERVINSLDATWDKQPIIDRLLACDLLVIDDLGAERRDKRKAGYIFNIIDSRITQKKPMIITTNLTAEDLKAPEDKENARIYDRLFEGCHPVNVTAQNMRRKQLIERTKEENLLLGIE